MRHTSVNLTPNLQRTAPTDGDRHRITQAFQEHNLGFLDDSIIPRVEPHHSTNPCRVIGLRIQTK